MRVTEVQTRLLEALERYRFLTASQFRCLGISPSLPVIWRSLRALTQGRRAPVGAIEFPASMRIEHVERVHYLTRHGASVLADILGVDPAELDFSMAPATYHRDYWHRKFCVDFQIWLDQALEAVPWDIGMARCERYFDKTGANRTKAPKRQRLRARTRVDFAGSYLIPDVTFVLESVREPAKRAVYAFEMTNGRNTKRTLTQMARHAEAMRCNAISNAHGVSLPHRALFLFAEFGLMQAVARRIAETVPDEYWPLFFLALREEAERDVLSCWYQPGNAQTVNFVTGR